MERITGKVPAAVLTARQQGMQDWMRDQGLAALVVFGQGSAPAMATRSHGNLRYLADWDSDFAPSVLVLLPEGAPHLVTAGIFQSAMAEDTGRFASVTFGKGPALSQAVVGLLPKGLVAIAGRDEIPLAIWQGFAAAGALEWPDATPEFARRRMLKDATQIALHREAAGICDAMFAALPGLCLSGRSTWQIQVALEALAKNAGAELCKTWLTIAPAADRCRFWRDENARIPQPGDQVALGMMVLFHGHWGHAIRTMHMGAPGQAAQAMYDVVRRAYDAMLARLQPGLKLADANAPFEAETGACLERLGHPPGPRGEFRFRAAHALGHSYEDPIGTAEFPQPYDGPAAVASDLLVQPGMLFELHPNLFVPGVAGASIGDMVLITEGGPEVLTRYPTGLTIISPS
ncbi:aminopeptidase P family protein [Rhodovarius crocodyli]|uniref:Aminopeptidase P family protein n=1 Tax=Rhodovarius crocodyli TaxID=1979269 RepID=A0A437MNN7_9PROT|nr:M24 family metallopeptidase [Rhodovarius crocodyli]RVT99271.1 aminopeptidase P family protein [Rhodovarius crocodyli]